MDIISRAAWGARPPKSTTPLSLPVSHLILHHAAGAVLSGDDTVSDADLRRIRSIQDYHMDVRGWNDIAYNYVMDPDGNLFEGRGTNRGGATRGYNSVSIAVCVMGNYDTQPVDSDLVPQLARFARHAYDQRWVIQAQFSGGHRDYGATSCPGNNLYSLIHDINRLAQEDDMPSPKDWTEDDFEAFADSPAFRRAVQVAFALTPIGRSGKNAAQHLQDIRNAVLALDAEGVSEAELDARVKQLLDMLPDRVLTRLRDRLG